MTDRELVTGFGRTRLGLCVPARSLTTFVFSSYFFQILQIELGVFAGHRVLS